MATTASRLAGRSLAPPATVTRQVAGRDSWELARARPNEALRPFVREYVGWTEQLSQPLRRTESPTDEVPLIINFGAPFRLFAPGTSTRSVELTSFLTGAYDTYQIVESVGHTHGVQVNFTLLGMRLLAGRPIEDMTNRALAPDDLFGAFAHEFAGRLYDAPSWEARFDYLDRILSVKLQGIRDLPAGVRSAWEQLLRSSGQIRIQALARDIGWSHRHFIAQFRHELGVSPKAFSRMLRFGRFARAVQRGDVASLADGAVQYGYYDQSHLSRDARAFAGTTPGELLKRVSGGH